MIKNIIRKIYYYFPDNIRGKLYSNYINYLQKQSILPRDFPWYKDKTLLIGKPFLGDNEYDFYAFFYETCYTSPSLFMYQEYIYLYKYEIMLGKKLKDNTIINISEDCVLPYAINTEDNKKIANDHILITNQKKLSRKLPLYLEKRWHHVHLKKGEYLLKKNTGTEFILGKPIPFEQKINTKYKLVLPLFIDCLTGKLFENDLIFELMPYTMKFFSKGTICKNANSNADWTRPSLPSISLGQYVSNNNQFHNTKFQHITDDDKTMGKYYNNNGYLTFQISSAKRATPGYGFTHGYDRTIYKNSMNYHEIISQAINQIEAFPNRNQFGWLSFLDAHHSVNLVPELEVELEHNIFNHTDTVEDKNEKSVFKKYNTSLKEMYYSRIKHLDKKLKLLYDYIENNYDNNEILIILHSDHGTPIYENDPHLLSEQKVRVPLMFRGGDVDPNISDEIIENVDILPSILSLSSINYNETSIDGKLPKIFGGNKEREFAFSESIYAGQTYKAVIIDNSHWFSLETKDKTNDNGQVNMSDYKICLLNKKNKKEEKELYIDKANQYTKYILDLKIKYK